MRAREFIQKGESAITIFTSGKNFSDNGDGSGTTGFWVINPKREVDKVIIYLRGEMPDQNDIYLADHAGIEDHREDGRCKIALTGLHYVGSTNSIWYDFAGPVQNPIRFIEK